MSPRDLPPNVFDNITDSQKDVEPLTTIDDIRITRQIAEQQLIDDAEIAALMDEFNIPFPNNAPVAVSIIEAPPSPMSIDDDDEATVSPEDLDIDLSSRETLEWMD